MMTTLYGIKNCDTMKKARQWLDEQGVDYHFHDYRKDGVPEDQLRHWIAELGWQTVINRRGTTWRKLDPVVRERMDAESAVEQALANPSLIKRPILRTTSHLRAGFNPDEWKTLVK